MEPAKSSGGDHVSAPSPTRDSLAWIVAILPVPLTIIAWNALPN